MPQIPPKTAIIIHRWDGSPKDDWYPALRKALMEKGFRVLVPTMPNSAEPNMHAWISKLNEIVGKVNEDTLLIGHSIGCQTILRWLSMLPQKKKVGRVVLVAPWMKLKSVEEESAEIARPWEETPTKWDAVRKHAVSFTCIFSDNDPYVNMNESKTFKEKLHANSVIEKKKGHFTSAKEAKIVLRVIDEGKN